MLVKFLQQINEKLNVKSVLFQIIVNHDFKKYKKIYKFSLLTCVQLTVYCISSNVKLLLSVSIQTKCIMSCTVNIIIFVYV